MSDPDFKEISPVLFGQPVRFGLYALASLAVPFGAAARTELPTVTAAPAQEASEKSEIQCGDVKALWLGGTVGDIPTAAISEGIRASDTQFRAFRLEQPQMVRIDVRTNDGGDPSVRLLSQSGEEIGYNDDMSRSLNARLISDLAAGSYCMILADTADTMNVTVQVGTLDQPSLNGEDDLVCGPNTPSKQFGNGVLNLANGEVNAETDAQSNAYLRFKLENPTALTLRTISQRSIDPQLALFNASGEMVASNDDADGNDARLDFYPTLAAGEYCIGVGPVSNGGPGKISVQARTMDPKQYVWGAYERGELPPMDDSYPVAALPAPGKTELVMQGGAANWFRFELTERAVMSFYTLGTLSGVDTKLSLFSAKGELIEQVDDVDSSTNAAIETVLLQPGMYSLALVDVAAVGKTGTPLRPVGLLVEKFIDASK